MLTQVENPAVGCSGFVLSRVLYMDVEVSQYHITAPRGPTSRPPWPQPVIGYADFRGGSYLPLLPEINSRKATVNPKSRDN